LYTGDNFGISNGGARYWGIEDDISGFQRMIETYKQYDFEICISGHSEPQTKEIIALLDSVLLAAKIK